MKTKLFESNKDRKLKSFLKEKNSKNSAWIIKINKSHNLNTSRDTHCSNICNPQFNNNTKIKIALVTLEDAGEPTLF